jgi:uncharacterized protein YjbI with pentapeptide repeats
MAIDAETGIGTYRGTRIGPGADLRGKILKSAVLRGADLEGADLTGAILSKADLTGADLFGAKLIGADLTGARLDEAILTRADLTGAILEGASISDVDFSDANLTRADLRVKFSMTVLFRGADLTDTNFKNVELIEADFSGAILKNTNFKDAELPEADFTGAILKNTNFSGTWMDQCRGLLTAGAYSTKDLKPKFNRAVMFGVDLAGADLSGLDLSKADLRDACLRDANLTGTNLEGAKLGGANLAGARFTGAVLKDAEMLGAHSDGRTSFVNAIMPDPVMYRQSYGEMTGPVLKMDKPGSPVRAADFKKAYPIAFERLKKDSLGRDFTETLKESIKKKYVTPFSWVVSRKKFAYPDQRISKKVNEVICLNMDCREHGLSYDSLTALEMMVDVMRSQTKHPIEHFPFFTLGWVRYTRDDAARVLLIEEIQSDLVMVRGALMMAQRKIADTEDFSNARVEPELWDELRELIKPYAERFYEDAVGLIFQDAEALGYTVEILSYTDKTRIIPGKKAPSTVYQTLPWKMGIREKRYTEVPTRKKLVERVSYYKPNPEYGPGDDSAGDSDSDSGSRRGPGGYRY